VKGIISKEIYLSSRVENMSEFRTLNCDNGRQRKINRSSVLTLRSADTCC